MIWLMFKTSFIRFKVKFTVFWPVPKINDVDYFNDVIRAARCHKLFIMA